MAFVKIVLWSCLGAILGYFAIQEFTVVTESFLIQKLIPAKRKDVFDLLINPDYILKFHPLCVGITNVTTSHRRDGMKTVQFVVTEKTAISLAFFEINQNITFPVNETVIEENAIIENRALLMGGYFTLKQRWKMADYTSGSGDKISSLEDHFQVTSFRILLRYSMKVAFGAHNTITENIIQHFLKESKESNDKSG